MEAYAQRDQTIHFGEGVNCFVFDSPVPFFMKVPGGQRLRFQGLYFQEQFFAENNIPLYDSFWRDAKNTIHGADLHAPELVSIYRRIEQCRLTGLAFDTWLKGFGLEAAGYLIDLVQQLSAQPPGLSRRERDSCGRKGKDYPASQPLSTRLRSLTFAGRSASIRTSCKKASG